MPEIVTHIVDVYAFRQTAAGVEFLQLLRSESSRLGGTWQAVHGHIEAGEAAWQAARRELLEETGLAPLAFWQIEHVNTFYAAREDRIHMCAGFAAQLPADAAVRLCHEHTAFRWLAAETAPREFLWPGQRTALREIIESIVERSATEPFLRIDAR
jgi:dATP pyrophosphohydrolase